MVAERQRERRHVTTAGAVRPQRRTSGTVKDRAVVLVAVAVNVDYPLGAEGGVI
jgi:hypothetical protein